MKEKYVKPTIVYNIRGTGIVPLAAAAAAAEVGAALLAGYAAGRVVANAMEARTLRKLQTLQELGDGI